MQARYYDPVIGRFYSNDPVDAATFLSHGKIQGFNRYKYANNNPYKYIDPDGNQEVSILRDVEVLFKSFGYSSSEQGNANIAADSVSALKTVAGDIGSAAADVTVFTAVTTAGAAADSLAPA